MFLPLSSQCSPARRDKLGSPCKSISEYGQSSTTISWHLSHVKKEGLNKTCYPPPLQGINSANLITHGFGGVGATASAPVIVKVVPIPRIFPSQWIRTWTISTCRFFTFWAFFHFFHHNLWPVKNGGCHTIHHVLQLILGGLMRCLRPSHTCNGI